MEWIITILVAVAAAALGAAGMYAADKHPRQVKKALKKAGKEAEKAMMMVEKALK